MVKKRPPYDFILEELDGIVTDIKPMFGAYGVYRGSQILMILRKKEKFDNDTGMWLGVVTEHVPEIKKEIPELRDLIKRRDPRIGRTPKARLNKTKKVVSRGTC